MAIEAVGLGKKINKLAHTLSSGQKMRLALSKLGIGNRPLWLLDEPFNSLDLEASKDLDALINQHLGGGGMVVITTHQALNINPNNLQTICLGP
jgi:heme exporter protein A